MLGWGCDSPARTSRDTPLSPLPVMQPLHHGVGGLPGLSSGRDVGREGKRSYDVSHLVTAL
jgi:hypothetical protein